MYDTNIIKFDCFVTYYKQCNKYKFKIHSNTNTFFAYFMKPIYDNVMFPLTTNFRSFLSWNLEMCTIKVMWFSLDFPVTARLSVRKNMLQFNNWYIQYNVLTIITTLTKCRTFFWTFVIFPESKLDLIFISFFWALHSFQKAPNCIFNFLESKWNFTCAVKQFWKHPNMMKVNNIDRNSKNSAT